MIFRSLAVAAGALNAKGRRVAVAIIIMKKIFGQMEGGIKIAKT